MAKNKRMGKLSFYEEMKKLLLKILARSAIGRRRIELQKFLSS